MKMQLVRAEPCQYDKNFSILAVEFQPNWGERACVREFRGFSSVWRELPKLIRQPTWLESYLHDREEWWKYHYRSGTIYCYGETL